MSQHGPSPETSQSRSLDPWVAFGRLVAGVGLYGAGGWLLDRWLGTSFLLPVGIVAGAALGLYVVFASVRER